MIKRRNKRILAILAVFFLVLADLACELNPDWDPEHPSDIHATETKWKQEYNETHVLMWTFEAAHPTEYSLTEEYEAPSVATPKSTATSTPDLSAVEQFFKVWSLRGVENKPTVPTTFTTQAAWLVTEILTYHWNDAQGMLSPGTIGLRAADGTMYGPWQATGLDGQGGVPNVNWVVNPNIIIPPGDYTVIDSDPGTWSQNEETGGAGMSWGMGIRQGNP
jgi:hypothetical protein